MTDTTGPSPAPPVGVGHSHLTALIYAHRHRDVIGRGAGRAMRFLQLLDASYQPNLVPDGSGGVAVNPTFKRDLDRATEDAPFVFSCVSGNEYHAFGLVKHPRPFDFVLPRANDLPLDAGAEIVPFALVDAMLRAPMGHALATMQVLRDATHLPIFHVQSPPPIPSEAHIRAHSDHFRPSIEEYGVSPAPLRLKLWRLQSQIYEEECARIGFEFLPVPTDALDADGFLSEAGWNLDPTHANNWYGEFVLRQLEDIARGVRRRRTA